MSDREMLILKFNDVEINFIVEKVDSKISVHSGNELKTIKANLKTKGKRNHNFIMRAKKASLKIPLESAKSSEIRGKFKLKFESWSSKNDNYNYNVKLEEVEQLKIDKLRIDDIEFNPYKYKEREDKTGAIISKFKIEIDENKNKKIIELWKQQKYFDVVRKGINNNPIKMRFGKLYWSEVNNNIKYFITLVEDKYDENKNKIGSNQFERNQRDNIAFNRAFMDELVSVLIDKEILQKNEVEKIKNNAEESYMDNYLNLYKIDNVNELDF